MISWRPDQTERIVQPSPLWLQYRLEAIGLNPINNIVDVTNFVMAELAQPMHAVADHKCDHHGGRRDQPPNGRVEPPVPPQRQPQA